MSKLYLSGPMAGLPGNNFAGFHAVAKQLRLRHHHVFNPAELDKESKDRQRAYYMLATLSELTKINPETSGPWYDYMVQLPGWEQSVGAQLEMQVACEIGLKMRAVERFLVHENESEEYAWNPADQDL